MQQRQVAGRWVLALAVLVLLPPADLRGPHHPRSQLLQHTHHRPERGAKMTADSALLRDVHHIQEDLADHGATHVDTSQMSPEELEFYYFKLHDYDNNSKLDGLELLHAINHAVEDSPLHNSGPVDDFNYFVDLIDRVLEEDDVNGDGFLSYPEYVKGRDRDRAQKKLAEPPMDEPAAV